MLPLFKSHFSIGKSILKLSGEEGVFSIAKNIGLQKVFLVEDSLTGFLEAAKLSKDEKIQLVFGLRISVCDTTSTEGVDCHKVIIFAKNDQGCKLLNKIYSTAFTSESNTLPMQELEKIWVEKNLSLCIPFYDSFIYNNSLKFSTCMPNFSFCNPTFIIESNNLPFDNLVKDNVLKFCKNKKLESIKAKSIFYKNRSDFKAYQTYKLICNRSGWKGKSVSIECPNIDHCGSDDFCIESYKESI
jgi:DNA polymerase III alpha subunit